MDLNMLATVVVFFAALFLVLLGAAGWLWPERARRFFAGFATDRRTHFLEIVIRMMVGAALVLHAPASAAPRVLAVVGWVLLGTSLILALLPWRWHRDFAKHSVASAMRHLGLLSSAAIVLGVALYWAAFIGRL